MITLEGPAIAFYILIAVAAIELPDKRVAETEIFFDKKMTEGECRWLAAYTAKSIEFEVKIGDTTRTSVGTGKLIYTRFVCAPVPQ